MLKTKMKQLVAVLAISSTFAIVTLNVQAAPAAEYAASLSNIEQGKQLSFDGSKGNCLACHAMKDGNLAGTTGPMLIMMSIRYKDRQALRDKIWGTPETQIKNSMMPPFGRHGILTEKEIDLITDYVYSL